MTTFADFNPASIGLGSLSGIVLGPNGLSFDARSAVLGAASVVPVLGDVIQISLALAKTGTSAKPQQKAQLEYAGVAPDGFWAFFVVARIALARDRRDPAEVTTRGLAGYLIETTRKAGAPYLNPSGSVNGIKNLGRGLVIPPGVWPYWDPTRITPVPSPQWSKDYAAWEKAVGAASPWTNPAVLSGESAVSLDRKEGAMLGTGGIVSISTPVPGIAGPTGLSIGIPASPADIAAAVAAGGPGVVVAPASSPAFAILALLGLVLVLKGV